MNGTKYGVGDKVLNKNTEEILTVEKAFEASNLFQESYIMEETEGIYFLHELELHERR